MKVKLEKSELTGNVSAPTSKSLTIRALMCAALAKGESRITNPLVCEDTSAAINVLKQIGVNVQERPGVWRIAGGSFRVPNADLFCGESATTLRFMTAIASLFPGRHKLTGGPSLTKRPMRSLVEALGKLGIKGTTEGKTTPPVIIDGGTLQGSLTELPGNISSQFVSALLLIAPFSRKGMQIRLTTQLTSRSYVLMTLRCLRQFGIDVGTEFDKFIVRRQRYRPAQLEIEGDWSSASYFLALGAVSDGITVANLTTASLQGDRVILEFLRSMGAVVRHGADSVTVSRGELKGIKADLSDCIDLLPTVAVLAALAEGVTELTGIQRARIKESNRVAVVKEGLGRVGISVSEDRDRLTITGIKETEKVKVDEEEKEAPAGENAPPPEPKPEFKPAVINSRDDHRIAMAFGILGVAVGGITIEGAECVAKTYPGFWEALKSLGGKVVQVE